MGNTWRGTSDESLARAEIALLKRAGLKDTDYKIHNTQVDLGDPEQYIHCVEILNSEIEE